MTSETSVNTTFARFYFTLCYLIRAVLLHFEIPASVEKLGWTPHRYDLFRWGIFWWYHVNEHRATGRTSFQDESLYHVNTRWSSIWRPSVIYICLSKFTRQIVVLFLCPLQNFYWSSWPFLCWKKKEKIQENLWKKYKIKKNQKKKKTEPAERSAVNTMFFKELDVLLSDGKQKLLIRLVVQCLSSHGSPLCRVEHPNYQSGRSWSKAG